MLNNKAILKVSAMNNAFNDVFYESLFKMMKLSRNFFLSCQENGKYECWLLERL